MSNFQYSFNTLGENINLKHRSWFEKTTLQTKLLKEDVIYCIVFLIKIFHKENEAEGLGKLELFAFAANRSISNL